MEQPQPILRRQIPGYNLGQRGHPGKQLPQGVLTNCSTIARLSVGWADSLTGQEVDGRSIKSMRLGVCGLNPIGTHDAYQNPFRAVYVQSPPRIFPSTRYAARHPNHWTLLSVWRIAWVSLLRIRGKNSPGSFEPGQSVLQALKPRGIPRIPYVTSLPERLFQDTSCNNPELGMPLTAKPDELPTGEEKIQVVPPNRFNQPTLGANKV